MTTPTIRDLLNQGSVQLKNISDTPALDSQLLLTEVTGQSRAWLYAHDEQSVSSDLQDQYCTMLQQRSEGKPVAQLLGRQGFWQRDFKITSDTLVPRPETELIVETVLARFDHQAKRVIDLGTGSGAIAVSLAAARPAWEVTATDISEAALSIARENATGVPNVRFQLSDWLTDIDATFDLIISNPPYLATDDEHLAALRHEPARALISGSDGLEAIREIIREAPACLNQGGWIMLEHGYTQQPVRAETAG